jgi:hypothetical protein
MGDVWNALIPKRTFTKHLLEGMLNYKTRFSTSLSPTDRDQYSLESEIYCVLMYRTEYRVYTILA